MAIHIYYFQYESAHSIHVHIQTNLSSIHYHSLNVLVHRPFISGQETPTMPGIKTETARQNLFECTRSAENLTLLLKEIEKHYSLVSEESSYNTYIHTLLANKKLTIVLQAENRHHINNSSSPNSWHNPSCQFDTTRLHSEGKGKEVYLSYHPVSQADEHYLGLGTSGDPTP